MAYVAILDRAPKSALVEEAQAQVDLAIAHFQTASQLGSGRAKQALVILSHILHIICNDLYMYRRSFSTG
jgi:hypothetical protein